jgi:predicted nucleotidyltransferase
MSLTETRTEQIVDQLPKGLLDRIVAHLNPQKVILFGSRARGGVHADSDWDFLVVMDDDAPPEKISWKSMYEARQGIRAAIDIIPCRQSRFNDRIDIVGSLPWIATTHGVVVYERSEKN